jgi:hypothetical protein
MKERIDSLLSWANEQNRPKKILIYFLVFLVLSGIFAVVREIYFPPKVTFTSIPNFYTQSDKEKEKFHLKEARLEKVMKELHSFQEKMKSLTKNDSMRIEYLYNEYKKLKNEP